MTEDSWCDAGVPGGKVVSSRLQKAGCCVGRRTVEWYGEEMTSRIEEENILGFRDRLNFCIWGKETRNDKIDQHGSFPNPPDWQVDIPLPFVAFLPSPSKCSSWPLTRFGQPSGHYTEEFGNVYSSGESFRLNKIHPLVESESTRGILPQNAMKMTKGILPNPISSLYNGRRKLDT